MQSLKEKAQPDISCVNSLKLTNFRSYSSANMQDIDSGVVVLYGSNGAGKTNVLEALSLLTPGRGIRMAKPSDILRKSDSNASIWSVVADISTEFGFVKISTGKDRVKDRRIVKVNGELVKSQSILANYLSCVWLTPQMDRLFIDSAVSRRRFFDRMVYAYDAGHSGRIARYENALLQRSKLLKDGMMDVSWLGALETQIAETGVAIAAARLDFVQRLQVACDHAESDEEKYFPKAKLGISGMVEKALSSRAALEAEDIFKMKLLANRERDRIVGGSSVGPHRSDLDVYYASKNMPASQCSTGEQKALLIGVILAHARLLLAERGCPPLMLLDEVAAHLDEDRRRALYDRLFALGGQVWMTGTDLKLFNSIRTNAQFFEIDDGLISEYS